MKNMINQDERILSLRRKIQSDAYQILIYGLLASILIQQFILKAPFSQFAVEFICLILMGIYMTIRHLTAGIDLWNFKERTNKKIIINGLTSSIISVTLIAVLEGERNLRNLVILFLIITMINFIANYTFQYLNKKRQRQIDDKLSSDDMDE